MKFVKKPQHIDKEQLPAKRPNARKIAFAGKFTQSSYPLSMQETLKGNEIKLFVALKKLTIDGRVLHELDQKELAKLFDTSQSTISRRMSVLRIQRWITLLHTGSKTNLKGRNSYLINEETMSLADTIKTDKDYLVFLHENVNGNQSRVRQLSKDMLFNVPTELLEYHQLLITESDGFPKCSDNSLLCTDELRGNQENASLCKDNTPLCTDELQGNQENASLCKDSTPLCTDELRGNTVGIYNTAHVHAPTHLGISYGYDNKTISSARMNLLSEDEAIASSSVGEHGSDSDRFIFFYHNPIIREVLSDLNAHPKFGKKASYAICNYLKAGRYETKNGECFYWEVTEDVAIEMLVVLLNDCPNSVIDYLHKLILNAHNGIFFLRPKQQALLTTIHRRINPNYAEDNKPAKQHRKLSIIQQLFNWQFENSSTDVKEFIPVTLAVGAEIEAVVRIPFWNAEKGDVTSIQQFEWETATFEDSLYVRFNSLYDTVHYDQICKGLELGVIKLCE